MTKKIVFINNLYFTIVCCVLSMTSNPFLSECYWFLCTLTSDLTWVTEGRIHECPSVVERRKCSERSLVPRDVRNFHPRIIDSKTSTTFCSLTVKQLNIESQRDVISIT